jgi:chemotaxis protein methyltransferase CheR
MLPAPVLADARALVADRLGLAFPARRAADLERALSTTAGPAGAPALLSALRAQPAHAAEWRALIHRLTVRESYFFRDAPLYAALEERVLPALIEARRAAGDLRLRLWSAGCAAGAEPYSLAMLLDRLLPDRADWTLTILATDIDADELETAARGLYTDWALRATPGWARMRHFQRHDVKHHELAREIRELVTFAPLNLAADPYPGALDVIVCRNVLMYFTDAARHDAVGRLAGALAPGGWLALSPLDAMPELEPPPLEAIDERGCRLLRRSTPPVAPSPPELPRAPAVTSAPAVSHRRAALPRARAEADRGRLEAARALCGEALRDDPLDADAHVLLAAVEEERGDHEAAIAALRRAIYAAPESPAAHFRLGGLLVRSGAGEAGRRSLATAATLLGAEAPEALVPGGDGLTAGRLLAAARAQLEPAS